MRVISGSRKGHRLKSPKGNSVRPTEDRIKESLFNILGKIHEEAIILDLFSGTGSIGIEFLSRGAKKGYFVDKSKDSIDLIKSNLEHTRLEDRAEVLNLDAQVALSKFEREAINFDYIYIDPPYIDQTMYFNVLDRIHNIITEQGLVVVEHEKSLIMSEEINNLYLVDQRNYRGKIITFFRKGREK